MTKIFSKDSKPFVIAGTVIVVVVVLINISLEFKGVRDGAIEILLPVLEKFLKQQEINVVASDFCRFV